MTPLRPECYLLVPLRNALLHHAGLGPAQRCTALYELKRALCPCLEACDLWAELLARSAPAGWHPCPEGGCPPWTPPNEPNG